MENDILGVAIKYKELVICLPKPNRHCDVIYHMWHDLGFPTPIDSRNPQGFYTRNGEFLDRKQALKHAKYLNYGIKGRTPFDELYSENLW